jgi:hypothetical protein
MLFLFLACSQDSSSIDEDVNDVRIDYSVTDADLIFSPPDMIVEAYSDQTMCWYDTYNGDTVGITGGRFLQHPEYGHHVIVMRTNADEDDVPDGTIIDCAEGNEMVQQEPFILPTEGLEPGAAGLTLPEGMANKFKGGERLMIQSHHINYTDKPILLNDRVELSTIPIEEVETFAAPLIHTSTSLEIGSAESTKAVECVFEEDLSFLYVFGHMHEYGTSIKIEYTKLDGSIETLYDLPVWDVEYRDNPPITRYELEEMQVKAGESFTTTCSWNNTTDEILGFPEEMCVASAMVYPATVAMVCDTH